MNYFSNICRICMSRDIDLINIYYSDDDMITYIDKLNTCIPEIFTSDNYIPLPDQICELCCKNLKIVFWFRELCLKSNTVLRQYHLKLENGFTNKENIYAAEEKNCNNNDDEHNSDIYAEESLEIQFESEDYLSIKLKSESSDSENEDIHKIVNNSLDINNRNLIRNLQETTNNDCNGTDKVQFPHLTSLPEIVQQPFALQEELERDLALELENESHVADSELSEEQKLRHLCSFCGKPFKYRQDMRIHERIHTGYKPYTCEICSKTFAKSTRLKLHMNTHTREKSFVCKICNKKFNQSSNLGVHMKLHTQTERFSCHLCEKSFSQKRHLRQHILFHENERRFTCEICNWNFGMKHHLKRHMMTHTGQRPPRKELPRERERSFSCNQCDWSFMSKEVLKKHLLMHTRENPKLRASLTDERRRFSCPKCIWSFTKKHHLERHMVKHENRIFPCTICKEEFRKNYELQRHLKTVHSEQKLQGTQAS